MPAQTLLWEGVRSNPAFGGIIMGIGETFGNMAMKAPKQFESVLQVANRNTEFIDSPGMQTCLTASDFKLSELKTKRQGVSLYLSLPQRYMSTHYRWLRMIISLTVTEMEKVQGQPATGHRVLMCLDEFAGLKHMEVIQNAVAQIAGYGVTLFFVLQSLEQLKATYKDNWETFLSNSGLKIFLMLRTIFRVSMFLNSWVKLRSSLKHNLRTKVKIGGIRPMMEMACRMTEPCYSSEKISITTSVAAKTVKAAQAQVGEQAAPRNAGL